jgi:hypothetical protein
MRMRLGISCNSKHLRLSGQEGQQFAFSPFSLDLARNSADRKALALAHALLIPGSSSTIHNYTYHPAFILSPLSPHAEIVVLLERSTPPTTICICRATTMCCPFIAMLRPVTLIDLNFSRHISPAVYYLSLSFTPVPVMLNSFVSVFLGHWLGTLLIFILFYLASNYFKQNLNRYPGPFLASLTDWWRFFDVYGRRPEITHIKLHRKYGDIVRLGPKVLSFADPAAVKDIYGLNKGFVKVPLMMTVPSNTANSRLYIVRLLSSTDGLVQRQTPSVPIFNDR